MYIELTKKQREALDINADNQLLEDLVNSVLEKTTVSDRNKVDRLLHFDHTLHGNLDVKNSHKDSDKRKIMKKSRIIYRGLKKIDKKLGESFLQLQDDV